MRGCLGIGGILLAGGSVAMLVTLVVQAPAGGITSSPGAMSGAVLLILTLAVGLATSWYVYGSSEEREEADADDIEGDILRAVREHDGRMTGTELADETTLDLDEAEEILARLAEDEYIRVESESEGENVYVFPEFDDLDEHELLVKLANLREFDESSEQNSD